jgi:hypothetical protein
MPEVRVITPPATHGLTVWLEVTPDIEQPLLTGAVTPLNGSTTAVVPVFGEGEIVALELLETPPVTFRVAPPVSVMDESPFMSIAFELVELTSRPHPMLRLVLPVMLRVVLGEPKTYTQGLVGVM